MTIMNKAKSILREKAQSYLHKLCVEIQSRRVGSTGNQTATDLFADIMESFGFKTESQSFDCVDWIQEGAYLTTDSTSFDVFVSPYSSGCHVRAPLVTVSTIEELEAVDVYNKAILLQRDIAKEQLMPKNFPFFQS